MQDWKTYLAEIEERASTFVRDWSEDKVDQLQRFDFMANASRDIPRMAKRIQELEEALEFYANNDTFQAPKDWNSFKMGTSPSFSDCDEVSSFAREVLNRGVEE